MPSLSLLFVLHFTMAAQAQCKAGIDVSLYQGSIDWQRVKNAGITFAIARVTVGQGKQDSYFNQNWSGMKMNNITPAAYHYFKGHESASDQVTNIKSILAKTDFDHGTDILAIDVESANNAIANATVQATTLHELMGNISDISNVYIYCNYYFWEESVAWQMYDFSVHNLWISNWSNTITPIIPTTWKNKGYTWWQYSSTGTVDGISGFVDLNRSNC